MIWMYHVPIVLVFLHLAEGRSSFIRLHHEDNVHITNDKVISYLMLRIGQSTGRIEFDSMTCEKRREE